MKSFREWLTEKINAGKSWYSFGVDEYLVHVLWDVNVAGVFVLHEAQYRGKPLGGQYSAQLHPPHGNQGMQHIHVYARDNQIFALNMDGTAHDKSHGVTIPNKVADAIRQHFPRFTIPANNIIENADSSAEIAAIASLLED